MLNWLKNRRSSRVPPVSAVSSDISAQDKATGNAALRRGDFQTAAAAYRRALAAAPTDIDLHVNLGYALIELHALAEAHDALQGALAIDADSLDALHMLGQIARKSDDRAEALHCFERVLAIQPDFVAAYQEMLGMLLESGDLAAVRHLLDRAVAAVPDHAEFHFHLANLHGQGNGKHAKAHTKIGLEPGSHARNMPTRKEAIAHFKRAIALAPDYFEALNNLGNLLEADGQHHAAVTCFQAATALRPHQAETFVNLGGSLTACGELDAAIAAFRTAIRLDPALLSARSSLLFVLSQTGGGGVALYQQEAQLYGVLAATDRTPCRHDRRQGDGSTAPLRVGLVSGDLGMHPVGYFLENIVAHLDPKKIVLIAYATAHGEDALTARISPKFAAWRVIADMNDAQAAEQIGADQVDILIDLAGHTAYNRLPLFALKPAPLQVSWLGYWASTGVMQIDYLLADPVSVPPALASQFCETIWRLPHTRLCFSPPTDAPAVAPAPAIENGFVTFGCFQRTSKITPAMLQLWSRILAALPQARLRLQSKQLAHAGECDAFYARLLAAGIAADRIILVGPMSRAAYLAAHAEVDIILDTAPFPGGTTTCEALWMGVPTLTLDGETMLARQGTSLLTAAGLADWIAPDENDYVALAVRMGADLPALPALRSTLRDRVRNSPVTDAARFAKDLEAALSGMWKNNSNDGG